VHNSFFYWVGPKPYPKGKINKWDISVKKVLFSIKLVFSGNLAHSSHIYQKYGAIMKKDNILVIGAGGQIGAELVPALRRVYGDFHVIAADLKPAGKETDTAGPYEQLDVLNRGALSTLITRHDISQVYLLAAMLSATGEKHPQRAWDLNMQSLLNLLDLARQDWNWDHQYELAATTRDMLFHLVKGSSWPSAAMPELQPGVFF
jgi:hypothetical protein